MHRLPPSSRAANGSANPSTSGPTTKPVSGPVAGAAGSPGAPSGPAPKPPAVDQASQAQNPRPKKTKTQGQMKKVDAKATEDLGVEAALWGWQDTDQSLKMNASALESRLAQLDAEESAQEASGPVDESGASAKKDLSAPTRWKSGKSPSTRGPAGEQQRPSSRTATSHSNLSSVGMRLGAGTLRAERPPDAYALLREAKEPGVFFKEDSMHDGHTEEHEDPELAAAVEETIRQLFGVRGILRVGGGKNEKAESIVIVVAAHGFSEASLARVPEKVHRFRTVLAIPFELLPLRKDR